jgi:aromatic-L-amino-acid decarboxylase
MSTEHDHGRFAWHPEPELLDVRDAERARPALEALGSRAWQAALDYLYDEALRRAVGDASDHATMRDVFFGGAGPSTSAPRVPTPSAELLADFTERLAPRQLNAWHPGQLSYFTPPPLVMSIVGELLAQFAQQGVDVWHAGPSAAFVEEEVVRWLCDLAGYGAGSFGILTSGGVMANFMGLALARDARLPGIRGLDRPPRGTALEGVRVYASDQTHFSVARALDLLGFPAATLAVIPSDDRFRLPVDAVARAISADRDAGITPLAVSAVAGSTNTGSVDPIRALADLAADEGLWLHVDAAYGGAARLSADAAATLDGLELADSVTVDPHKWFFQAYDIGALLVRDGRLLAQVFSRDPEYYGPEKGLDFYRLGFEGTRRWRALKLWLSWRHLGSDGFGRLVDASLALARALEDRLRDAPDFELLLDRSDLSVACFRHLPAGADPGDLDEHQERARATLEQSGDGFLSTTRIRGRTWLRAGVVNYLSTDEDLDRVIGVIRSTSP